MLYWRRAGFYGRQFQDNKPKWHLSMNDDPDRYREWTAICGYSYNGILGGVLVHKNIVNPDLLCRKCVGKPENL